MKRLFDLILGISLLLTFFPLISLIYLLVLWKLGSPVLFTQKRPGLNHRIFLLYKFRTMTSDCDEQGTLLPDAKRLTQFGKFLRSTSLDELPSLINVIKGDMSLVGPRPLLVQYLERYSPEQARRHELRPGITGWAQINGRNAISWEKKFELDVWYVENHSLWLDLKILFITLLKTIKRSNISQEDQATMEEFKGSIEKL